MEAWCRYGLVTHAGVNWLGLQFDVGRVDRVEERGWLGGG